MKKCNDCKVEMIPAKLLTNPLEFTVLEEARRIELEYVSGTSKTTIFGKTKEYEEKNSSDLKARLCPKCGKVELYIDIE